MEIDIVTTPRDLVVCSVLLGCWLSISARDAINSLWNYTSLTVALGNVGITVVLCFGFILLLDRSKEFEVK